MKVPVEWVNSLLEKELGARQMADAMELAGIEVEEVKVSVPLSKKIVVGKIMAVRQHPNADRLKLAAVDVGEADNLSIVCGAPNLAEGQLVAVARVGAVLPEGMEIKKSMIRGEESQGMICSERELGLSDDHAGILVLEKAKIGQNIGDLITTKSIIDVKTSANRWDLTSIQGIAREVSAQTGVKTTIKYPDLDFGSGSKPKLKPSFSKELLDVYMLAPLRVDISCKTPVWIVDRLISSGVRPINVVVDITNYVMLQDGQPLHAFDAAKVRGGIEVRSALRGETLITLDGIERKLDPADIVIADDKGVIGLAGVMGGANSEIDATTVSILLEAASFNAAAIRKAAIRHGLRSEASARFERGVPAHPHNAMAAAIKLLEQHAGAKLDGTVAVLQNLDAANGFVRAIAVDPRRIGKFLGMDLDGKVVSHNLRKLEFMVDEESATGALTVTVPWWRADIKDEADIAEEIIKLIGYDKLQPTLPPWRAQNVKFDSNWTRLWEAKAVLRSLDLFEVATYSFISKRQIEDLGWRTSDFYELANPKSSDQAYLRENLLPSLLATLYKNRKYSKQFGVFEFSKGFIMNREGELPNEQTNLGVLVIAPNNTYKWVKAALDRLGKQFNVELAVKPKVFDKIIAHPKRSGLVYANGKKLGLIGQLHPDLIQRYKLKGEVAYLEISWNQLAALYKPKGYVVRSPYPTIERDITVLVNAEVSWESVRQELLNYPVSFVGDFYGPVLPAGKKSLSLRITISRFDRTPTEADANLEQSKVFSVLNTKFKATPRA